MRSQAHSAPDWPRPAANPRDSSDELPGSRDDRWMEPTRRIALEMFRCHFSTCSDSENDSGPSTMARAAGAQRHQTPGHISKSPRCWEGGNDPVDTKRVEDRLEGDTEGVPL